MVIIVDYIAVFQIINLIGQVYTFVYICMHSYAHAKCGVLHSHLLIASSSRKCFAKKEAC